MASVIRRGDSWQVKWRQDGRQQAKSFPTHREAREWKSHIESALYRGVAAAPEVRGMTLRQWWTYWMQTRVVRPSTLATGRSLATTHILPTLGSFPLSDLTHMRIQTWISDLGLTPSTTRRVFQELRTCLNKAVQAGYLTSLPCKGVSLPKAQRKPMRILDHDEIRDLAQAVPEQYAALIYLLGYGGLRIGEALALSPTNFRRDGIHVLATVTRNPRGHESIGEPKTEAGRRVVPLPSPIRDIVRTHIREHPGPWLFNDDDGRRLDYWTFNRRIFRPAAPKGLVIHDLRHTAITHWIRAGVDLPRIAAWAGHASPTVALDFYASFFDVDTSGHLEALSAGIRSGGGRASA